MYEVVDKIPKNYDVERRGEPLVVLEDEYGGQSVIGIDDHCFVLYNGSDSEKLKSEFKSVKHWYPEAANALRDFLDQHYDFKP